MNQQGISSLVLLFIVVLGIFIIWETNEYIDLYVNPGPSGSSPGSGSQTRQTFCLTGEEGNCNDSNDVFLLTE